MSDFSPDGLGWHQDVPDFRDLTFHDQDVIRLFTELRQRPSEGGTTDLSEFFVPARNQGCLRSSAAHACANLVEYFQRRSFGQGFEPSVLFIHQMARRVGGRHGTDGLDIRSNLHAMKTFGVPPESYWPYEASRLSESPEPMLFSFADKYHDIRYIRLDVRNSSGTTTLASVKAFLDAGFPSIFGVPIPSSLDASGDIPYRPLYDSVRGGQAMVAVGYDDRYLAGARGALLVLSSWGPSWGNQGYGWLPYAYVEQRLACDFWTLAKPTWLQSGEFGKPAVLRR